MNVIKKSALAVVKNNRLLVVKPRNSQLLLMPGGKPKEGESAIAALKREIMEELGCGIDGNSISFLGTFEDVAAGHANTKVSIDLYTGTLAGEPKPSSEIEELKWVSAKDALNPFLTPILKKQILPFLVGKGALG